MSQVGWIDASAGAAGDMLLAALIDAGADQAQVATALERLSAAAGEHVGVRFDDVRRHGLRARHAVVLAAPSTIHRGLAEVLGLVAAAGLAGPADEFAVAVFRLLADAESRVHGVPAADVRFHEVGALDSLADVIGCAAALHSLGLLDAGAAVTVSSVGLGNGTVRTAHGPMPVPVPAVIQLLAGAGAPAGAGPGSGELCTPTGAALLVVLAASWGPMPAMLVRRAGSGAGRRDPAGHPNIVRIVVGEQAGPARPWRAASLRLIESTIDDLDPRLWPDALEELRAAGAVDCWLTPVLMRSGRPGQVVSALTGPDTVESVVRALLRATTTLGVRVHEIERLSLPRDMVRVEVGGQPVQVKRGLLDGAAVTVQPEFADARDAARFLGVPVADVIDAARESARALPVTPSEVQGRTS